MSAVGIGGICGGSTDIVGGGATIVGS